MQGRVYDRCNTGAPRHCPAVFAASGRYVSLLYSRLNRCYVSDIWTQFKVMHQLPASVKRAVSTDANGTPDRPWQRYLRAVDDCGPASRNHFDVTPAECSRCASRMPYVAVASTKRLCRGDVARRKCNSKRSPQQRCQAASSMLRRCSAVYCMLL